MRFIGSPVFGLIYSSYAKRPEGSCRLNRFSSQTFGTLRNISDLIRRGGASRSGRNNNDPIGAQAKIVNMD
jgi:hypothetical protein